MFTVTCKDASYASGRPAQSIEVDLFDKGICGVDFAVDGDPKDFPLFLRVLANEIEIRLTGKLAADDAQRAFFDKYDTVLK
jgi:hypothetical protein